MEVYTNKFNQSKTLKLHSRYDPKLTGREAAQEAIALYKFPQPLAVKDFTGVFGSKTESIYFDMNDDPYNEASQPAMASVKVNITIDNSLKTHKYDELCLLMTTEPLFEGLKYVPARLNSLSKYVYLSVTTKTYTIKNVHPGKYYLYSYDDINMDKKHKAGDYMSSNTANSFTVLPNGTVTVDTKIDMVIPW